MEDKQKKSVTMKDVAQRAGVSVGTVSRVINQEQGIKKTTLEKVQQAIAELDYIPDVYARGMKTNRTETVALILPTIWHPFFSEFAFFVEEALSKKNYKLLLCNTDGAKKEIEYLSMLRQNKVDGIIAITYSPIEDYLASNIPFVSIDRTYQDKEIACVTSDNQTGGELAARMLLEKGCQHLAFVGSHNNTVNETKKRRQFFEETVRLTDKECLIFDLEEPFDNFLEQLEAFLEQHPQIDGIFAINDFTALEVMHILVKQGKRVPDDVQIIGYDGIRMAKEHEYLVSTIKQPLEQMAEEAVSILLSIIDHQTPSRQSVLPISYVEGKTTKNFSKTLDRKRYQ
ncbi:substrate-binding domain-containing protein [Streptococcus sp. zg-86]|uniref:Substrate-binding domain-containing protein n=1 Tax=Streptococcus zhangguiae TaxID=2664091 RepID=A0A6I4RAL0_9STRE|nr:MULTISPECIES: LacI family DNA-binding transcriptional regulator [unclassified Streptococcus]MTB63707.1 substrate-binding domain-containing protein [Streptococcus sp. zg-86]MTB90017.1 substrate-binding domain-containing protein [Streptococcus sp. zg-36]MWV55688.1 substrate-binding domain-containing protein [Streptococcus sp. zg-70]QTH48019.1 LacI family DNA-binding transcriptional regulator [Streptococcus sp. zg-86]